ncbi:hypothetical protein LCGC14_2154590 [marine sediment metagenome]|uniref:Uncharacterized protein n=1 Tax=marine sediment metagenome TaxID=412755 RepID=A0A0F9EGT4_9ZZZZ
MTECIICGTPAVDKHEIFFGHLFRKLSIQYGFQVLVCRRHHDTAHGKRHHKKYQLFDELDKRAIQKVFCDTIGIDYQQTLLAMNQRNKQKLAEISSLIAAPVL